MPVYYSLYRHEHLKGFFFSFSKCSSQTVTVLRIYFMLVLINNNSLYRKKMTTQSLPEKLLIFKKYSCLAV